MSKPTIGILYDFDKTLCTTDMQEYDFIKKLGMTSDFVHGIDHVDALADLNRSIERTVVCAYRQSLKP